METRVNDRSVSLSPNSTRIERIKAGAIAGLPIVFGYLPIGIAYGVMARQSGLSLFDLTMMSVLVFAGAAQFMAANMIFLGTSAVEIVVAIFVLNFRHFVMSFSFMNRLKGIPIKWKLPLSLGITDETFTISALNGREAKKEHGAFFYASMILVAYFAWIAGSLIGGLLGDVIPAAISQSMGIALYAMFIGLLMPSVKKEIGIGLIAILSMLLNYFFGAILTFSDGWSIVLATLLGALFGVFLLKDEEGELE